MTPLAERIATLIAAQGPMSIAQFMTAALLDQAQGYYTTRQPFGSSGDFITAPDVSQMFGELLGLWLAQAWIDQGRPKNPRLVELGPGRGTLMNDALRALKAVPDFRAAIEIVLVEASPALRAKQQETLTECGVTVRWVPGFDAVPMDRPLFLVANEFFDALPIHQYVRTERGWCERMVGLDAQGALSFALSPAPYPGAKVPASRDGAPSGGVYEMSPASEAIVEDISRAIASKGGAALIVDYGYDEPAFGETLQAVASHRFADMLTGPGMSDLSAHVDFVATREAARRGGAAAFGPAGQGEFLTTLGIIQRAEALANGGGGRFKSDHLSDDHELQSQLERLILPEQMGTLFKALAIVPPNAPMPPGF